MPKKLEKRVENCDIRVKGACPQTKQPCDYTGIDSKNCRAYQTYQKEHRSPVSITTRRTASQPNLLDADPYDAGCSNFDPQLPLPPRR